MMSQEPSKEAQHLSPLMKSSPTSQLLSLPDELLIEILSHIVSPPTSEKDEALMLRRESRTAFFASMNGLAICHRLHDLARDAFFSSKQLTVFLTVGVLRFRKVGLRTTQRLWVRERGSLGDDAVMCSQVLKLKMCLSIPLAFYKERSEIILLRAQEILMKCKRLTMLDVAIDISGNEDTAENADRDPPTATSAEADLRMHLNALLASIRLGRECRLVVRYLDQTSRDSPSLGSLASLEWDASAARFVEACLHCEGCSHRLPRPLADA
jgi:hypothetical protein